MQISEKILNSVKIKPYEDSAKIIINIHTYDIWLKKVVNKDINDK